jgi:hypothetical protein
MSLTTYLTGGLTLACVALYVMWSLSAAEVRTKDATIKAKDVVIVTSIAEVAKAKATNRDNLDAIAAIRTREMKALEDAAKFQKAADERAAALNKALRRIASAPKTDDGPLAPVLKRELDSLRTVFPPGTAGPDGANEDPSGNPAATFDHRVSAPPGTTGP